jgi:hypothetical protein
VRSSNGSGGYSCCSQEWLQLSQAWGRQPIEGIRCDSFGDFDGFLLRAEERVHESNTRERDLERLVTHAWRERISVRVSARAHARHMPTAVVILGPPREDEK